MGEYTVKRFRTRRLIRTTMSGIFDLETMKAWADEYRAVTDEFEGLQHIVLADMRGLGTMRREVAEVFGEAIEYARRRGVVLCAHVSDDTVQRLQACRVARQGSSGDDVTVDCVSVAEATRVCAEAVGRIDDANPVASIRQASL